MDLFAAACGVIATAIAVLCSVPYVTAITRGKTKPHQFTWIIFVIMNGIVTVSQFLEGATFSVLISLTFFIGSAIILALSFKKDMGIRDSSRLDRVLFTLCLLTIAIWLMTKNNVLAIWLTVVIDVLATSMLILKVRRFPDSEAAGPWAWGALAYVFACLSLAGTDFGSLYIRPIYGLLTDTSIVLAVIAFTRLTNKRASQISSGDVSPSPGVQYQ